MYCRRCDKEDVGGFHRCFNTLLTRKAILPLEKKPDKSKRISVRLLERLRGMEELDGLIKPDAVVERLYPGYWQRARGAWLWHVRQDSVNAVGSSYTMREILEAKELETGIIYGSMEIAVKKER